jgi:hypothetical protein
MKKLLQIAALAAMSFILGGVASQPLKAQQPSQTSAPVAKYVAGQVLVQFHDKGTTQTQALAALKSINPTGASSVGGNGLFQVTVDKKTNIPQLVKQIEKLPGIDFAQPNFFYSIN